MPDLDITIGGRVFQVSCQPGEEHFLRAASAMLDSEAQPLVAAMGRLPESRLLLMSGLMLADKAAAIEDENRQLKAKLAEIEGRPQLEREKLEGPVIPPQEVETLAELAARAEALAARVEEGA